MKRTDSPRVLVSAASKYGSTAEIASRIGEVLSAEGCEVTVTPSDQVGDLGTFDAIVLGSAVYMGRWRKEARQLAQRVAANRDGTPIWLFSSGPLGEPPQPEGDPVDASEIQESTSSVEHVVFTGKIDKAKLSFRDRAVMNAVHAPEGDFRNWEEISNWAVRIADRLLETEASEAGK